MTTYPVYFDYFFLRLWATKLAFVVPPAPPARSRQPLTQRAAVFSVIAEEVNNRRSAMKRAVYAYIQWNSNNNSKHNDNTILYIIQYYIIYI